MRVSLSRSREFPLQVGPGCPGGATFRTRSMVGLHSHWTWYFQRLSWLISPRIVNLFIQPPAVIYWFYTYHYITLKGICQDKFRVSLNSPNLFREDYSSMQAVYFWFTCENPDTPRWSNSSIRDRATNIESITMFISCSL